jgi:hypothetical protein
VAYTIEQYETLQAAIASGSNTVKYGDKQITYNSVSDMLKVLGIMKAELFPNDKPVNRKYALFEKGIIQKVTE